MDYSKTFAIVPCYNEGASIASTMMHLRSVCPEINIVAINDGSEDNTLAQLRSLKDPKLSVINMPVNGGIGTAVQTGLLFAVRNGAEYAVKFDGDGQHLAEEIKLLLEPLIANEADFVIGSRFLKKTAGFQSTFFRRMGIMLFRILSGLLTKTAVTDSTSGFRAYNRRALDFASCFYPSFDYPEPEECILFLCNNFKVREVSCKMAERQGGGSSISPLRAGYYIFKVSFAMIMERFRPLKKLGDKK